jgi:hypothetical protein
VRRRLSDQRLGVGLRGDRDVAALAVGDAEQTGLGGGGADRFQRRPAGSAEALEGRQLRLDRDAGGAGALDQRPAVGGNGGGGELGRVGASIGLRPAPGKLGRVGVEAEADLALALVDERGEPIGKRSQEISRP